MMKMKKAERIRGYKQKIEKRRIMKNKKKEKVEESIRKKYKKKV